MALVTGACYGQPQYVEANAPKPLPYGLFSVADMHEAGPGHWQQGVEWQPDVCGIAGIYACPTCVQNNGGTAPAKTYVAGPAALFAAPFTVYGSFKCSPVGNWDRAEERARQLLANGEQRAVELAMAQSTSHTSMALQAATSIDVTPTPGTPITISQALAVLEAYVGTNGSGQGVILANRREVLLAGASQAIERGDSQITTKLGTPVGALAGWNGLTGPNNVAAGAGQAWIFALGSAPRVWRSDVFLTSDREASLKTSTNDLAVLAERTYVVGWDCFTVAVLVANGTNLSAATATIVEP